MISHSVIVQRMLVFLMFASISLGVMAQDAALDKMYQAVKGANKVVYDAKNKPAYAKVYINLGIGSVPKDFYIHGSTIMADTHHPVTSTGFQPIVNLMRAAQVKSKKEGRYDKVFSDRGIVSYDGRKCHKIEINDDQYAFVEYTAKEGERVIEIEAAHNISAYKIMKLK